jgi:hypothetical protein
MGNQHVGLLLIEVTLSIVAQFAFVNYSPAISDNSSLGQNRGGLEDPLRATGCHLTP